MKKYLGIVCSLVLAVSLLMVPAAPVAVAATPDFVATLVSHGDASAEWSSEKVYAGDYSVKLYVQDGSVDWAEVSIPVDIAIEDIYELSFWEYIDSYGPAAGGVDGWSVNVILGIDVDGDGTFESDLPAWHRHDIDETVALDGDTFIEFEYEADPPMGTWAERDALANYALWLPLDDDVTTKWFAYGNAYNKFKEWLDGENDTSRIDKGMLVKEVILQIGGSVNWQNETAFVDDITINGILYDLEPSTAAVGMSARTLGEIIGISVDPIFVDFGEIIPGKTSGEELVTVTNIGNQAVDLDASIENESFPGFYAANLRMGVDLVLVSYWGAEVFSDDHVDTLLILSMPEGTAAGHYDAVLVFWAMAK